MVFSLYIVLVFVHLIAAFLMIGGSIAARLCLTLMRSASNGSEALGAYKGYELAPKLIVPAVTVTVLSGLALVWRGGFPWLFWMVGALVLWAVLNVWRVVVVVPPAKVLQAAATQALADPSAHGGALIAAARQPRLHLGFLVMELISVVIIALMVFKPT